MLSNFIILRFWYQILLFFLFNWRIIALQYYFGFCHTSTCISDGYIPIPSLLRLPPTSHPTWKAQSLNHSVQFSHSVASDSLQSHGLQHARPPYPSPTLRVYSNLRTLSWWCPPWKFFHIGFWINEWVLEAAVLCREQKYFPRRSESFI